MGKGKKNKSNNTNKEGKAEQNTDPPPEESTTPSASESTNQKQNRTSWRGGSWRGKATAIAEIARESIPGNTSSETASRPTQQSRNPSHRLSQSLASPGKSKATTASSTPRTVGSDASSDDKADASSEKKINESAEAAKDTGKKVESEQKDASAGNDGSTESKQMQERPLPAAGWRGWWSRPKEETQGAGKQNIETSTEGASASANATVPPNQGALSQSHDALNNDTAATMETSKEPLTSEQPKSPASSKSPNPQRSSWFGLWSSGAQQEEDPSTLQRRPSGPKGLSVEPSATNVDASSEPSKGPTEESQTARGQLTTRPASGSWAFWSRERPAEEGNQSTAKSEQKAEVGELAVSGTDSQSKPRPAKLSEKDNQSSEEASKKRQRPESSDIQSSNSKKKSAGKQAAKSPENTTKASENTTKSDSQSDGDTPAAMQQSVLRTTVEPPKSKAKKTAKEKATLPPAPQNAIFPSFESTYPLAQPSSYLSRISRYIPYVPTSTEPKHLYRSPNPHRIRRALAIGVHGYFPAALIQRVLGPPTGTSIKFADSAAAAIQQYCALHAYNADIEKVALEGEGTIDQRIENLWKLLLNWLDTLRKADFIFVACHSQGVPVAVGLVARLLAFNCIQPHARIGICAMAGINQGPFPSYQSRFIPVGSSTAELFQFAQPSSAVSTGYTNNLNTLMRHHVRVLYVGSLDDQLVALDSSTFATASHPYLSRAAFVDGREHPSTGDFLTRLVGFGLKLRNLGISDHGLIRELSGPLAGSLYGGEGHSRIYEDEAVYDLAVRLAVETETLDSGKNPALEIDRKTAGVDEANPFFLPWALRGVLEEEKVKREMGGETRELLELFEQWRPVGKGLRDVRFRLEAVRSKL